MDNHIETYSVNWENNMIDVYDVYVHIHVKIIHYNSSVYVYQTFCYIYCYIFVTYIILHISCFFSLHFAI